MNKRVVISGLGIVSPVGKNPEEFFGSLMAGRSGIKRLQTEYSEKLSIPLGATVDSFDASAHFDTLQHSSIDRVSQFALVAARQAIADAALEINDDLQARTGVYLGCCQGGANSLEAIYTELFQRDRPRVRPLSVPLTMNNAAAAHISLEYKCKGPTVTFATACSSSAIALGEAYRQVKHGYADIMIAGGTEALLTYGAMKAWEALRAVALEDRANPGASCKPFSRNRTGLVLGEGAAVLVLEDAERAMRRGAKIYAEFAGYDCSSDSSHLTKPHAAGQVRTMGNALRDAGLEPQHIGYINAHGTATVAGDIEETNAIKQVFGERARRVPVSSTKSMHGHLMGAAGAAEFAAGLLALQHRAIPPTINLLEPDPACDLDYVPNVGRRDVELDAFMSNSFAFGGTNAVLVAKRFA